MPYFSEQEIISNAHVVQNMLGYFSELKQRTRQIYESGSAQERGYFTADQDDQIQQLLVSYWQTRNALYDLIVEFRQRIKDFGQASPAEFLVPFSAALMLVDAARFMREWTEDRPIVRRKLNQPNPAFGIPGGTYDTIQKSLVSSRHAWHLYHALRLFEQRSDEFRSALAGSSLSFLLDIVAELQHRTQISLTRFANVKLRTRSDRWLRKMGRVTFGQAMYGFQKIAASLMAGIYVRPCHIPKIPDATVQELRRHLQPGDVILVRKEYAITNYFLPGYWPHVAMYLGSKDELQARQVKLPDRHQWSRLCPQENEVRVLESMKDGVLIRPLDSPMASDSFVVIRPRVDSETIVQALERGFQHEGKPYDFDFDFRRSDRLVCTEVVYRSFDGLGPIQFQLVHRAGRPTLSGPDLIELSLHGILFEPVAAYVPTKQHKIVYSNENLTSFIRETLSS